ncbi:MAG: DUF1801 domain-containing protein [Pseudohongiellaceae bacterium]
MPVNKIIESDAPVNEFLARLDSEQQRDDCEFLVEMMSRVVGSPAKMWGDSLIGFGSYHYKYDSGREGDFFLTGFAPRKGKLSIHVVAGFKNYAKELAQLGKHKTTVSCLYIKSLAGIDTCVLESMVASSVREIRRIYC